MHEAIHKAINEHIVYLAGLHSSVHRGNGGNGGNGGYGGNGGGGGGSPSRKKKRKPNKNGGSGRQQHNQQFPDQDSHMQTLSDYDNQNEMSVEGDENSEQFSD